LLLGVRLPVEAQEPHKIPRIGLLLPYSASTAAPWEKAFYQGLHDLGWIEGRNLRIERRYSEGQDARLPSLAAELVNLNVDVILTSITPDTLAAKNATSEIPIVMASVADPVGSGFVDSLARPGGNITGMTNIAPELAGKWLELLKETVPKLTRVAMLWDPTGTVSAVGWKESQIPARALGLQLYSVEVHTVNDFDKAFAEAVKAHVGAVAIGPLALVSRNLKRVADLAISSRLPALYGLTEFVHVGGLLAYGPDRSDLFRRAATYVDKILKGRKPADLPVERPVKFDLVINLKTAKQIGLIIPQTVLFRADQVIK
jgi:putative ABC transport system substrate-binding protein